MSSDKKWSKCVKARDNYKCLKCGLTKDEAALEAHHIIKRPGKSKIKDGVTLCKWCHLLADMGKNAFRKWLNNKDFYDALLDYLKKNNPDIYEYISKLTKDELKFFLGALSKFEKQLKIKRSLAGRKASDRIR